MQDNYKPIKKIVNGQEIEFMYKYEIQLAFCNIRKYIEKNFRKEFDTIEESSKFILDIKNNLNPEQFGHKADIKHIIKENKFIVSITTIDNKID